MADNGSSGSSVQTQAGIDEIDEIEAFYDFLDREAEVSGPDPCRIERAFDSVSPMDDGSLVVQSTVTGRLTTGDGGVIGTPAFERHRDRWQKRDGRWRIVSAEKLHPPETTHLPSPLAQAPSTSPEPRSA